MKLGINRRRVRSIKLVRRTWVPGLHLGVSGRLKSFLRHNRLKLRTWPESKAWEGLIR